METGKRRKKRMRAIKKAGLNREMLRLRVEILRLEQHLRELYGSKISRSESYQITASHIEELIKQKKKEIIELYEESLKKIE